VRAVWQNVRWKWSDVHEVISEETASAQDEGAYISDLNPNAPEFQSGDRMVVNKDSRLLKGRVEGVSIAKTFCCFSSNIGGATSGRQNCKVPEVYGGIGDCETQAV
jgi:hypothetical protein